MSHLSGLRGRLLTLGTSIFAFLIALAAGAFGTVLGIGGGLFIIPSLNLFLGVGLKRAIAASVVAVIATSLAGGNVYLRDHRADLRLGLVLALATAPFAVGGAFLATRLSSRVLAGIFALLLAALALQMIRSVATEKTADEEEEEDAPVHDAGWPGLRRRYRDPDGGLVEYQIQRLPLGILTSGFAGLMSGLLGVGGGVIQVPVMNLMMKVPLKVASATSTYIIGMTAMAGAFVYYNHKPSFVDPALVVPVALGVFAGASFGTTVLRRISPTVLRWLFVLVVGAYCVQMVLRVFGLGGA